MEIFEKFDNIYNRFQVAKINLYSNYPPVLCKTFWTAATTGSDIKIYTITYTSDLMVLVFVVDQMAKNFGQECVLTHQILKIL